MRISNNGFMRRSIASTIDLEPRGGNPSYINTVLPQEELYGLYQHSDVLLVSAIRDGMNLVAKEYAAAQVNENGVLVLSDQTGAHEQLGR